MKHRVTGISKFVRTLTTLLVVLGLTMPATNVFAQNKADDEKDGKVKERVEKKVKEKVENKAKEEVQKQTKDALKKETKNAATDTGSKVKRATRKTVEWTKQHPYIAAGSAVGVVGVAAATGGGGGGGGGSFSADMAGTYHGTGTETFTAMGESMSGSGPITVTITEGGQVTFASQARQASGTMSGNSFSLPVSLDVGGGSAAVTVNGTVSGNTVTGGWSGSGSVDGVSYEISGSFSATK